MKSGASASVGLPTPPAPVTEVLEYRPHEDGYLQLELRRYIRRDGSGRERGPYWYFQFHEGGKRIHTSLMVPTGSRGDWRMIVGSGLLLPCTVDRKEPTLTTA